MDEAPIWDDDIAGSYDQLDAQMFAPDVVTPMVDRLVELANGGSALEFAIGTGRIAVPLAARGVPVSGIESSEPMLRQLRAKPGGGADEIPVVVGDMATASAPGVGTFSVVYLVYNTITNLLTQDAQVACFANAARHLTTGGAFVVETFVPQLRRLPPGERFVPFEITPDHIGIDEYDTASQRLVSHHVHVQDGHVRRSSMPFRYVWPAELDLMARLAGMRLRHRWADWSRSPFVADSPSHVSVWQTR